MTRLADCLEKPVRTASRDEVADHYDEKELSALVHTLALTYTFNHVDTPIRGPTGTTWG